MRIPAIILAAITLAACDTTLNIPRDKPGQFQGFYLDSKRGCVVHSKTEFLRYWAAHSANKGMLSQGELCPDTKEQIAAVVAAEVASCKASGVVALAGCQYAGPSNAWAGAPRDNPPSRNFGTVSLTGAQLPEVRRGPLRLPVTP